jgi:hypothetical protein
MYDYINYYMYIYIHETEDVEGTSMNMLTIIIDVS